LAGDADFLMPLVRAMLQEVLEAEMTEALGAGKGERTDARLAYWSGYYGRSSAQSWTFGTPPRKPSGA
jgi:putative transposase